MFYRLIGKLSVILFFCLFLNRGSAQKIEQTNQQWFQYNARVYLNEHWKLGLDLGYRQKERLKKPSQYITRSTFSYVPNKQFSFGGGFAQLGSYGNGSFYRQEFRPHQELRFKQNVLGLDTKQRLRIEERFFDNFQADNTFNFRFRYRFLFYMPLDFISSKIRLRLGDEIFINSGKTKGLNVFDQNRFLIGPQLKISDYLSMSLIFNHQFKSTKKSNTYNQNSVFVFGIKHEFKLVSKSTNKV